MATLYNESDLGNIVMKCPDEDTKYKKPDKMYDSKGKRIYAYVTLIMFGDSYIPGALVLAKSIRDAGSEADLVVLVTPDVSMNGRYALRLYFDRVIEVNYIKVQNWRGDRQRHRKYLNYVFTKFHIFSLVEYKKVILIDADAIVLKYPDHLFTLNTPAGCYLEDKSHIITYDKDGNYILPPDKKFKWYDEMCNCCGHGERIDRKITDRILKNYRNSGIGGGIMVLEPQVGELDNIIFDVSKGKSKFLVSRKLIWPEQQYLSLRYSGRWHGINPRFFGLQGYPHWKVLYGLQYGGDKPFMTKSKMDMKIRLQFPDYILWHDIYAVILSENPKIGEFKELEDCMRVHKVFMSKKSLARGKNRRGPFNHQATTVNSVSRTYGVMTDKIRHNHLKYYHTNGSSQFSPRFVRPMFNNIKEFDYVTPIKNLAKYHGTGSYYGDLYNRLDKSMRETNGLDQIKDPIDIDLIMMEYIKCRPNTFVISLWPKAVKHWKQLAEKLEKDGNVYYSKRVTLTDRAMKSLFFWMYDEFTFKSRMEFIGKKVDYSRDEKSEKDQNTVIFFFFDNVQNKRISGQGSPYKKELRRMMMKNFPDADVTGLRGNDIIHINDRFSQTIEYAQMILNNNSLNFLNDHMVDRFASGGFNLSNNMLQTMRRWMYTNLSQVEMTRLILICGFVLFVYGIRNSQDIDGILTPREDKDKEFSDEDALNDKVYRDLQNDDTSIYFIDVAVEGSSNWKEKWTQKNDEIFEQFGIKSTVELSTNPRYHMYCNGVKFYLPRHEIMRKIIRNRSQDHIDFILLKTIMPKLLEDMVDFKNGDIVYREDIKHINNQNRVPRSRNKGRDNMILHRKYFKSDINMIKNTPEFKNYFN